MLTSIVYLHRGVYKDMAWAVVYYLVEGMGMPEEDNKAAVTRLFCVLPFLYEIFWW